MIFAAGFDSSRNIFLGEKATKWENGENEVDGLTTNGVLIMHPKGAFCPPEECPNPMPGIWREVSVSIRIHSGPEKFKKSRQKFVKSNKSIS